MLEVVGSCCKPTALHIGLYQGFLKEIRKKYASCCIIACVLIWLREKDLNQRPPGYRSAPPCGSRKNLRAFAFLDFFDRCGNCATPSSAPGSGVPQFPTSSLVGLITRKLYSMSPQPQKQPPDGDCFYGCGRRI